MNLKNIQFDWIYKDLLYYISDNENHKGESKNMMTQQIRGEREEDKVI